MDLSHSTLHRNFSNKTARFTFVFKNLRFTLSESPPSREDRIFATNILVGRIQHMFQFLSCDRSNYFSCNIMFIFLPTSSNNFSTLFTFLIKVVPLNGLGSCFTVPQSLKKKHFFNFSRGIFSLYCSFHIRIFLNLFLCEHLIWNDDHNNSRVLVSHYDCIR